MWSLYSSIATDFLSPFAVSGQGAHLFVTRDRSIIHYHHLTQVPTPGLNLEVDMTVTHLATNIDGTVLAAVTGPNSSTVCCWQWQQNYWGLSFLKEDLDPVTDLVMSENGKTLTVVHQRSRAVVWLLDPQSIVAEHRGQCLSVSRGAARIAFIHPPEPNIIKIVTLHDVGRPVRTFTLPEPVDLVRLSDNGKFLVSCCAGKSTIQQWAVDSRSESPMFSSNEIGHRPFDTLGISNDGRWAFVGAWETEDSQEMKVCIFDTHSERTHWIETGTPQLVLLTTNAIVFHQDDGRHIKYGHP